MVSVCVAIHCHSYVGVISLAAAMAMVDDDMMMMLEHTAQQNAMVSQARVGAAYLSKEQR